MKKKTFARIGAVVLSVMLLIVLMPATAFATDKTADKWDGTVDTAWFTGTETEYNIDSAAALAGVSQLAAENNTFQGITLNLTTDVDLDGLPWTPIENFHGTFNGNHHKVSNMYVELVQGQSGFFEYLFQATVENLTVDQANVVMTATNSGFYQGILAGWAQSSTIINCGASGKLTADISGSDVPCISGFIGSCKQNTRLQNCWSLADVTVVNEDLPAMVGGLVGQWENAADGAAVIDCYFGGSVLVADDETSAAGIMGAALSFNGEVILVSGCVSYGTITVPETVAENAIHIVALDEDGQAQNCLWPDDGKMAVVRLVVDWSTGTASADPNFDEQICGHAVSDFSDPAVLAELNENAQTENLWALGISGYPVFASQTNLIRGDYSKVEEAKAKVPADLSLYSDETVAALQKVLNGINYDMSIDEQAEIDALVKPIEDAVASLVYKDADYSKVDAAIAKAESLNKKDYKDFSEVEAAIQAVVRGKDITKQSEVDAMAKAIEDALANLEVIAVEIPKTGGATDGLSLWFAVLFLSGGATCLAAAYRKKLRMH